MNKEELLKIKSTLLEGKVIAFPTETVMGLGVIFDDFHAYNRLNSIKRRPEAKPYTMMLSSIKEIEKYAYLSVRDKRIISKFMPGPLTVLLKAKKNIPGYVTHDTGIIGIRVPDMEEIRDMIHFVDKPLLVPSANRSGEKPLATYQEVIDTFGDELGYIIKKDSLKESPSTIIDLTKEEITVIRTGKITLEDIKGALKNMRISLGSDHGGLEYKNAVKEHLLSKGYEVVDVGTNTKDSCDYPVFGINAAKLVASGECDFGVVICTSGEGIMMAANKVKGIRCGLAYNDDVARLMRQHNDANMIAFGQKFMELEDVIRRVDIFLVTEFEGGRHQNRVNIIIDEEK